MNKEKRKSGREPLDDSFYPAFGFSSVGLTPSIHHMNKTNLKKKISILQRLRNWLKNRTYEPFFPDDENALETYTRNRQTGGA